MGPCATLLSGGTRLHLQHGPIDLIIGADGQRQMAFEAAKARFETVLSELVADLPVLRTPLGARSAVPGGATARQMTRAASGFGAYGFLTPMACVAGAVADTVLQAMTAAARLDRAYVNNGGDIALHLSHGAQFTTAMSGFDGTDLGRITLTSADPVRGIATSGRHGRSLSLGVADSVTVLAKTATQADLAATLIANAVDLPGSPLVTRRPASDVDPDSDLGDRLVVLDCAPLPDAKARTALRRGLARANDMQARGLICGAGLFVQGHAMTTQTPFLRPQMPEPSYA